jgi:RNA polymerase sigma factor (sigma-70 family)
MKLARRFVPLLWQGVNFAPSFEDRVAALLPQLRRFAHALSKNRTDADDLTQATLERALRSRTKWSEGSRLDSWLYRIMRNLWIDTARSRKEKVEAPVEEADAVADDPSTGIEAAVDLGRAMAAMERLPPEQREVVALILVEGFGYAETALMLDLPVGTVSSRLARGRTALLEFLGDAG